jgi:hypothetical protein
MTVVRRATQSWRLTEHPRALKLYITALIGVIVLLIGAYCRSGTIPNVILLAVGATILASDAFIYITTDRRDLASEVLQLGIQSAFLDRRQALTNDDWTNIIRCSRHTYKVLGVANHGYMRAANEQQSQEALLGALSRGVEVAILWLDPLSDFMVQREAEEGKRETKADAISAIEWFWNLRESISSADQKERLQLKTYKALPTGGITWVDDDLLIVTHYLASEPDKTCPGFILAKESPVLRWLVTYEVNQLNRKQLAEKYIENFKTIDKASELLDQSRVDILVAARPMPTTGKTSEEAI